MYGEKKVRTSLEDTLKGQQQYPNFPISIDEIGINGASMNFTDLYSGQSILIHSNITVSCVKLSHPDGVLCYKIVEKDAGSEKIIVYATDTEHRSVLDPRLLNISQNADILIYDAQYTPEEYSGEKSIPKFDWGHSTYEFAVDTALKANVKRLVLFHHDPEHDDNAIDSILDRARERMMEKKATIRINAAMEGIEIII